MKIYTFWDRGKNKMPFSNRYNVAGWIKLGYDVTIVDLKNMNQFFDIGELPKNFDTLIPQHQSDCVRCLLLLEHAPCLWLDSSIILLKPLDWWTDTDKKMSLFNLFNSNHIENWMIYVKNKNNIILRRWYEKMRDLHEYTKFSAMKDEFIYSSCIYRYGIGHAFMFLSPLIYGVCAHKFRYLVMHVSMCVLLDQKDFKEMFDRDVHVYHGKRFLAYFCVVPNEFVKFTSLDNKKLNKDIIKGVRNKFTDLYR